MCGFLSQVICQPQHSFPHILCPCEPLFWGTVYPNLTHGYLFVLQFINWVCWDLSDSTIDTCFFLLRLHIPTKAISYDIISRNVGITYTIQQPNEKTNKYKAIANKDDFLLHHQLKCWQQAKAPSVVLKASRSNCSSTARTTLNNNQNS